MKQAFGKFLQRSAVSVAVAAAASSVCIFTAAPVSAQAEGLQPHKFTVIARGRTLSTNVTELPLWNDWIPEASGGALTATIAPLSDMGLDDAEMLRLLNMGIADIANFDLAKIAGDEPAMEGCDLAGLTLTLEEARKACDAWRPKIESLLAEKWNSKLLAVNFDAPQVIWCRVPIEGLSSLEGKKMRVTSKSQTDFLTGVGTDPVFMSWGEVIPAMQNGVFDCVATGTLSANAAGMPAVTTHIFPMVMGWSANISAMNLDSWNQLPPESQAFLEQQYKVYEEKFWELSQVMFAEGLNCNFNRQPCTMGKLADLTEVPVRPEEGVLHKQIMESSVLKGFAERCGAECTTEWNATVGAALDLSAPVVN